MKVRNHLAILRNLRNIYEAGVSEEHKKKLFSAFSSPSWAKAKILPFRFLAAAKACPAWEDIIDAAMLKVVPERRLSGKTVLLVDVSGSMNHAISEKSELSYMDAACGVAILAREMCDGVDIYTFSDAVVQVPARRGMSLRDTVMDSQRHNGTYLQQALQIIQPTISKDDRLIVVTDEQAHDDVGSFSCKSKYMINVAPYQKGVGYGKWIRVNGWSEAVLDFISEYENL